MIDKTRYNCSGCSACLNICPRKCIEMHPDALGFIYPKIDPSKCINCHLCDKVCDFNDNYSKIGNYNEPLAFAARHKNYEELKGSRSGAVFVAISDWILANGGVVYGAGFKHHFVVTHKRAVNKRQRDEFRGAKYVQSDISGILTSIANDLQEGTIVLFVGTPCQVNGLKSFLRVKKIDMTNLYLCDIICHGVGSPKIWQDYLAYLENKNHRPIISVNFRDKKYGWNSHHETFLFENKTQPIDCKQVFYNNIILRYSCYSCPFSNTTRTGDITIGDFWGWEKIIPSEFNSDDLGVSIILVNNDKGNSILSAISDQLHLISTTIADAIQPNLQHPTEKPYNRDDFESDCISKSTVYAMQKYGLLTKRQNFLTKYGKAVIRRFAKSVKHLNK